MLVLTRRFSQRVYITFPPSEREQTVVMWAGPFKNSSNHIRLCFEADRSIQITREEIYKKEQP